MNSHEKYCLTQFSEPSSLIADLGFDSLQSFQLMTLENLKPRRLEISISHTGGGRAWFSMMIKGQQKILILV